MCSLWVDHELRTRVDGATARPPVLYFLCRPWWPVVYQRLAVPAECTQVGDPLPDAPGGPVAAVRQWWTAYPEGGQVRVVVIDVN
jgi:hypothetical protein